MKRTIWIATAFAVAAVITSSPALAKAPAQQVTDLPGTIDVQAVSCPTATLCFAAGATAPSQDGGQGFVVPIVDGVPGDVQPVSGFTADITALSCPTSTFCESVIDVASPTSESGLMAFRKGKPGKFIPAPAGIGWFSVSCVSVQVCETVGEGTPTDVEHSRGVVASISKGKPGHPRVVKGSTGLGSQLDGVSCPAATSCVAVGSGVFGKADTNRSLVVSISNGRPSAARKGAAFAMNAISCASAGSCEAVGAENTAGIVVPISGGTAGVPKPVTGSHYMLGISCISASSCRATGYQEIESSGGLSYEGVTATVRGGTPSAATLIDGTAMINSVSCPAGGPCASGGYAGGGPAAVGALLTTVTHPRKTSLTLSVSPKAHGSTKAKVKLSLTVARLAGQPKPTGTVAFTSGSKTLCASAVVHAKASRAVCAIKGKRLGAGKHKISAAYGGDASYQAETASIHYKVVKG